MNDEARQEALRYMRQLGWIDGLGVWTKLPSADDVAQMIALARAPQEGWEQDAKRFTDIGRQVERACTELPVGWGMELLLERHDGSVHLYNSKGKFIDEEWVGDTFSDQISNAIDAAIAAAPNAQEE
jgi:hypothetical protein